MKISSFLQFEQAPVKEEIPFEVKQAELKKRKQSVAVAPPAAEASKVIKLALHIEQPDIILVEKMDDINCLALILNVSLIKD